MPEFADPMGVSLALVHSTEGKELFDSIIDTIEYRESNRIDCVQPRLVSPANRPADREQFWSDIEDKGIEYCVNKYKQKKGSKPFWRRVLHKIYSHLIK